MMKTIKIVGLTILTALMAVIAFIYSGLYPMGADAPHNAFTYWALETLRERSIARASHGIQVPPLNDSALLLAGGADYNDMCAGCHLKPGKTESDFSIGLYPKPPNLASPGHADGDAEVEAKRSFWIIKHGIKASGMPAWGETHDDGRIWAMVAFLQRLPELTPAQYQILTAREASDAEGH